jgi:hypothetical protein
MAEMVLVTPVLVLLVFGIIEFGIAFRTHQIITNSAREGARVAVLPSTDDPAEVEEVVRNRVGGAGLNTDEPHPLAIVVSCDGVPDSVCSDGGASSEVEIRYCQRFFVLGPIVNAFGVGGDCTGFGEIQLRTRSIMRTE